MPKMIFVNLPVKDIAAATRFYEAIGCTTNEQFSDHQASNMVWSDAIIFHLLTRDFSRPSRRSRLPKRRRPARSC